MEEIKKNLKESMGSRGNYSFPKKNLKRNIENQVNERKLFSFNFNRE